MFDAGQASFMALRHEPDLAGPVTHTRAAAGHRAVTSSTSLDPRTPWSNPVVWLLAVLHLGGNPRIGYTDGDPQHQPEAVSITTPDGSRAEVALTADSDGTHRVTETGPTGSGRTSNAHTGSGRLPTRRAGTGWA